jgi:hypothetical protein
MHCLARSPHLDGMPPRRHVSERPAVPTREQGAQITLLGAGTDGISAGLGCHP